MYATRFVSLPLPLAHILSAEFIRSRFESCVCICVCDVCVLVGVLCAPLIERCNLIQSLRAIFLSAPIGLTEYSSISRSSSLWMCVCVRACIFCWRSCGWYIVDEDMPDANTLYWFNKRFCIRIAFHFRPKLPFFSASHFLRHQLLNIRSFTIRLISIVLRAMLRFLCSYATQLFCFRSPFGFHMLSSISQENRQPVWVCSRCIHAREKISLEKESTRELRSHIWLRICSVLLEVYAIAVSEKTLWIVMLWRNFVFVFH